MGYGYMCDVCVFFFFFGGGWRDSHPAASLSSTHICGCNRATSPTTASSRLLSWTSDRCAPNCAVHLTALSTSLRSPPGPIPIFHVVRPARRKLTSPSVEPAEGAVYSCVFCLPNVDWDVSILIWKGPCGGGRTRSRRIGSAGESNGGAERESPPRA